MMRPGRRAWSATESSSPSWSTSNTWWRNIPSSTASWQQSISGQLPTSKADSRNDGDVGDQGISSFGGYKEDKNFDDINLGGDEEKGRSCGLDVSTQTEESQESAGECPSLVHFLKKSWRNTWSFAAAVLAPRQWISYPTRVWECTHRTLVIQTFRSSVHIFRHPLFQ